MKLVGDCYRWSFFSFSLVLTDCVLIGHDRVRDSHADFHDFHDFHD